MEKGDIPFFKDGVYITSDGAMINEGCMIEGAQSLDNLRDSSNYQSIYGII
jgi:hypothetical protein